MSICFDCGKTHGNRIPKGAIGCWKGMCEWCKEEKTVTSNRDFGYPEPPKKERTK